jgi:hypothetical protein
VSAQIGNEVVFVGSSTSGSADQHALVESATGTVLQATGSSFTDNVTGAVWANTGRKLYVGQSLMNRVSVADWNGSSASWSTFYSSGSACYGVQFDRIRNRVWTLTGTTTSARELVCLDGDLNSPSYGSVITQTGSLSGASRERWCLSFTGNLACVPEVFIGGNSFTLVDLDPSSPNYLNVIASAPVLGAAGAGFAFSAACEISLDEQFAYLLWTGIGSAGLAVWDITAQAWVDFSTAPGQQDLAIPFAVPNAMDLSLDRSFAVISGQGGAGWAARVDFDYSTPSNSTVTQYAGLTVPNCDGISLSPDSTRVAVTSTAVFLNTPSELTIFDATTGAVLQTTTLAAMWNVYVTAWQDASPTATYGTFGQGCPGTLGTPALAASSGSRPALGTTLNISIDNLPFGLAAMASGLSSSITSGGLPLPFDLSIVGMSGCSQLVDALILDLVSEPGSSATWSWAIPNDPSIFGFVFFNQAFAFDPAANPFGFTASNAGVGTLGY